LNLAEVVDVMARIYKRPSSLTVDALMLLEVAGLQVVPVDTDIGMEAGELHARLYDRRTSPLSMADCVALASAAALGEPLATSDQPLIAAAEAKGLALVRLMDSRGGTSDP
jgi:predicted nucleic acid-binding protein